MKLGIIKIFVVLVFICSIGSICNLPASAQTMSNGNYIIQQGALGSIQTKSTGSTNTIKLSDQTTATGQSSGTNYTVSSGLASSSTSNTSTTSTSTSQSVGAATSTLSFAISSLSIDFGQLAPGEPIIRTNSLTVNPGSGGYQVFVTENNPLQSSTKSQIPDTTCDNGNCSEVTADVWSSPLTYGFGYRCDNLLGSGCSQDFTNSSYFKAFGQDPQAIMKSVTAQASTSQITYKVNIPGTQTPGIYQNTIMYIAVSSL